MCSNLYSEPVRVLTVAAKSERKYLLGFTKHTMPECCHESEQPYGRQQFKLLNSNKNLKNRYRSIRSILCV